MGIVIFYAPIIIHDFGFSYLVPEVWEATTNDPTKCLYHYLISLKVFFDPSELLESKISQDFIRSHKPPNDASSSLDRT